MIDNTYLKKLEKYLNKEINVSVFDNEIRVDVDIETFYLLRLKEQKYILVIIERGVENELAVFQTEIEMKRKFALWMKNIFGKGIEYLYIDKFEDIENISSLIDLMSQYSDKQLYSIDEVQENKIILKKNYNELYDLFYVDKNGIKYIFEQNEETPFVFERLYTEVVYYSTMIERMKEYELVFDDKLDWKTKIQLLGYTQN